MMQQEPSIHAHSFVHRVIAIFEMLLIMVSFPLQILLVARPRLKSQIIYTKSTYVDFLTYIHTYATLVRLKSDHKNEDFLHLCGIYNFICSGFHIYPHS